MFVWRYISDLQCSSGQMWHSYLLQDYSHQTVLHLISCPLEFPEDCSTASQQTQTNLNLCSLW
ncbi:hypothetical protein HOLleu_32223 [Holothuria leucospilota]|uniref:Uncharacterized protein n=1 Tax=Holothuria leucospilota TaxID=206669 RepID=A0A9Q0YRH8_HOLLE|nr:hypothetical protein HOLleu_32223 [Holothuria leucospilota]